MPLGQQDGGHQVKSPTPCQHGGGHTESDHVGQRVQFFAEIAAGAGHARDAPVEPVEQHGPLALPVVAGVVALAGEDGQELGAGAEAGAGLAG